MCYCIHMTNEQREAQAAIIATENTPEWAIRQLILMTPQGREMSTVEDRREYRRNGNGYWMPRV